MGFKPHQHDVLFCNARRLEAIQKILDDRLVFSCMMEFDFLDHLRVAGFEEFTQETDAEHAADGDMRGTDGKAEL